MLMRCIDSTRLQRCPDSNRLERCPEIVECYACAAAGDPTPRKITLHSAGIQLCGCIGQFDINYFSGNANGIFTLTQSHPLGGPCVYRAHAGILQVRKWSEYDCAGDISSTLEANLYWFVQLYPTSVSVWCVTYLDAVWWLFNGGNYPHSHPCLGVPQSMSIPNTQTCPGDSATWGEGGEVWYEV